MHKCVYECEKVGENEKDIIKLSMLVTEYLSPYL